MDYYLVSKRNEDKNKSMEENNKEQYTFLNIHLKHLLSNCRNLIKTNEYNSITIQYGYLFEHIRNDLIKLFTLFIPLEKRSKILKLKWLDYDYNINLFNELINYDVPDFIYWIFLYIPYYNKENISEKRGLLLKLIDYFINNWPKRLYFKEDEFIFITQSTYLSYPLVYHNKSNKLLLSKICKLNRTICPSLNWTNPDINSLSINNQNNNNIINSPNDKTNNSSKKIKVCFISDSLTCESSVIRDRMGIILNLDKEIFDIYYAGTVESNNIIFKVSSQFKKSMEGKYIKLDSKSLNGARKILQSYNFNIIIYPDIGMKSFQTYLSYSRIAPIQINTWGHSDTSGIDTIDYYISSKYFELNYEEAKNHYSEKLVLLDSLSTYYYEPVKLFCGEVFKFKTREELKIPQDEHIYWCMQTFYKIDDEFEKKVFGEIIKRDKKAKIFLISHQPFCSSHLKRIIKNIGEENQDKIVFFPALIKEDFYNFIKVSDVLLDPYPFGGCNSSIEGITFDKPVITRPSDFINGRFTYGFYKKMGIDDCIVNNYEDYVELALKLTENKEYYKEISNKINKCKHMIFEEKKSIDDWSNILQKLCK